MSYQYNAYLRSEEYLYEDLLTLPKVFRAILEESIEELDQLKFFSEFSFNIEDQYGNTPLHVAVIANKLESVNYLLAQDEVEVDVKNMVGQTPLFNSCRKDKIEITERLIKAGTCINIEDCKENTPLHMSVCNPEITYILIQNGARIDVFNFYQDTPLHNAVTVENLETVCLLLYYNADPTIQNSEGNTPFMDALIYENFEIQSALFEYIDDFNIYSDDGDTILTLALTYQSSFVEEILSRGAKVNRRALESSLMIDNYNVFETIWKRMPNVELENSNLLDKLSYGMKRNRILKYIDIILENSDDSLFESLANCFNKQLSFMDFLEKCADNGGLEQLTKLTCVLLQYNCEFLLTAIFQVYYCFGYCDLFKYFLYMEYRDECEYGTSLGWIIPKYIYTINTDWKSLCNEMSHLILRDVPNSEVALQSLEYSVDFHLVQFLHKYFFDDEDFIILKAKIPTVPSLLQLARDRIRKYIKLNRFNVSTSSQFYTFINNIDIARIYKEIITLERKIYNFGLK